MSLFGTYARLSEGIINTSPGPTDGQLIYDTLSGALADIAPTTRVKGQKFAVKGADGEKPIEWWFVKDFLPEITNFVPGEGFVTVQERFVPDQYNSGLVPYLPVIVEDDPIWTAASRAQNALTANRAAVDVSTNYQSAA